MIRGIYIDCVGEVVRFVHSVHFLTFARFASQAN